MGILSIFNRRQCLPICYNCCDWAWLGIQAEGLRVHYTCAEIDVAKRRGLVARANMDYMVKPEHVVGDLRQLPGPTHDYISNADVTIRDVDIVIAGFACQDISFMKKERLPFNAESQGVSAQTFWGSMRLIKEWQPRLVLLENTCGLLYERACDGGAKPIDQVILGQSWTRLDSLHSFTLFYFSFHFFPILSSFRWF